MKIVALKFGKTEINEGMAFVGGSREKKLPISLLFFLIEQDGKKILVDTGCDTMPGFPLFEHTSPVNILREYGLTPNDITDVILTHSHSDHIEGVKYYKNANIYIHEAGLSEAEIYLKEHKKVFTFKDELEIVKGVLIKHIGGHSDDSSIVLINHGNTTYAICGDECYTMDNLRENKPSGASRNLEKNKAFIEEYGKPHYIPLLLHDPELIKDLGFKIII